MRQIDGFVAHVEHLPKLFELSVLLAAAHHLQYPIDRIYSVLLSRHYELIHNFFLLHVIVLVREHLITSISPRLVFRICSFLFLASNSAVKWAGMLRAGSHVLSVSLYPSHLMKYSIYIVSRISVKSFTRTLIHRNCSHLLVKTMRNEKK